MQTFFSFCMYAFGQKSTLLSFQERDSDSHTHTYTYTHTHTYTKRQSWQRVSLCFEPSQPLLERGRHTHTHIHTHTHTHTHTQRHLPPPPHTHTKSTKTADRHSLIKQEFQLRYKWTNLCKKYCKQLSLSVCLSVCLPPPPLSAVGCAFKFFQCEFWVSFCEV